MISPTPFTTGLMEDLPSKQLAGLVSPDDACNPYIWLAAARCMSECSRHARTRGDLRSVRLYREAMRHYAMHWRREQRNGRCPECSTASEWGEVISSARHAAEALKNSRL